MIKFDGRIVQFGFGAVGKSFYEKLFKEIKYDENKYFVITKNKLEFEHFINLGGLVANFIVSDVTKENFREVFAPYLGEGDLLIDFSDTVGTKDICEWCGNRNIMYINTGEADWADNWYSIFEENEKKCALRERFKSDVNVNKHPIVLHHGNNPGLVSHFVKAAIEYIVKTQFKKDKDLNLLIKSGRFNEAAMKLGVRMIHVNDIDLQEVNELYREDKLFTTWCADTFWFEMLSEATMNTGTHEKIDYGNKCNLVDEEKGFVEFTNLAADVKCKTTYPGGMFEGFLVPHEETISIAKGLEVKEGGRTVYRPTVMFIYAPCIYAGRYFENSKVNNYPNSDPNKPMDCEDENGEIIIRGYRYPKEFQILYRENISKGTEYVGVLLMGEKFEPVWVGNRIEAKFLYKDKKSYWQTPTITPVSMSALAAVCWMIKNKDRGGMYFPDDIPEYNEILKTAEKYISKTIYSTFSKDKLKKSMEVDMSTLQAKEFFCVHDEENAESLPSGI